MSHSKRNTSLAFFTNHERQELKGTWGSRNARLSRDSFLPFGSCQLCLLPARQPVACPTNGHLFCRECALSNILAQSRDIKRAKRNADKQKLQDADSKEMRDADRAARDVDDFEHVQSGAQRAATKRKANGRDSEDDDELARQAKHGGVYSGKRKKSEAGNELTDAASNFWIPEAIPDHKQHETSAMQDSPICPATDSLHSFSMKTLVTVNFSEQGKDDTQESPVRICGSCCKALSNTTKAILAKPCGHVVCKPCSGKFQRQPERSAHESDHDDTIRCYLCQEDITPGRKVMKKSKSGSAESAGAQKSKGARGLVELSSDGTGFAGGGRAEVKKTGLAFQC